jgi:hypothetical protein
MFNMKIKTAACLAISLASLNAFAAPKSAAIKDDVGSGRLHVQIANLTGSNCSLNERPDLLHGMFDSLPPSTLMINESKSFDMEQVGFGPDVILSYGCGDHKEKSIRFEVQQDLSILFAYTPKVTQLAQGTYGLHLIAHTEAGATWFWSAPGQATIYLYSDTSI